MSGVSQSVLRRKGKGACVKGMGEKKIRNASLVSSKIRHVKASCPCHALPCLRMKWFLVSIQDSSQNSSRP